MKNSNSGVQDPFYKGGVAGGVYFGTGRRVGSTLPRADLLSLYKSCNSTGTRLVDSKASGSYEVSPGMSTRFDGVMYGKLVDDAGVDTSVTLSGDFTINLNFSVSSLVSTMTLFGSTAISDGTLRIASNGGVLWDDSLGLTGVISSGTVSTGSVYVCSVIRSGDQLTVTVGDTSNTITCTTDNILLTYLGIWNAANAPFNGSIWDIEVSDSTGTVFSNFLAQQSSIGLMLSEVGPNVQLVDSPENYIHEDATYGHTWENYSDADANVLTDGEELWDDPAPVLGNWVDNEDGSYTANGSSGFLTAENSAVDTGAYYLITFDLDVITGAAQLHVASWTESVVIESSGSYSFIKVSTGSNPGVYGNSTFVGTISNISVQKILSGKIPADPSNPGYDVAGNALTNPGPPQRNAKVYGYTGNFDGMAYADTGLTSLDGGFTAVIGVIPISSSTVNFRLLGAAATPCLRTSGSTTWGYVSSAGGYWQINVSALTVDELNVLELSALNNGTTTEAYIKLNGVEVYSTSVSESSLSVSGLLIGRHVASILSSASVPYVQIYDATDTLIHHWVCEGDPNVSQGKIYDVVGGNHATLVDYPDPFFTVQKPGSYLLANGFALNPQTNLTPDSFTDPDKWVITKGTPTITDGVLNLKRNEVQDIINRVVPSTASQVTVKLTVSRVASGRLRLISRNYTDTANAVVLSGPQYFSTPGEYETVVATGNGGLTLQLVAEDVGTDADFSHVEVIEQTIGAIPGTTSNTSALGQPLTHAAGKLTPDHPVDIEMLPCVDGYEADTVGQVSGVELWDNANVPSKTGWSTDGSNALIMNTESAYSLIYLNVTPGTYLVSGRFDMTQGNATLLEDGGTSPIARSSDGEDFNVIATFESLPQIRFRSGSDVPTVGAIRDISVREVLDPINLFYEDDGDTIQHNASELLPQYGEESVSNGDFTAWTDDDPDGWTVRFTEDVNNYVTEHTDGCSIVRETEGYTISQAVFEAGKTYRISFKATGIEQGSSVSLRDEVTPIDGASLDSDGSCVVTHTATTSDLRVRAKTAVLGNISVKEITSTGANTNQQYIWGPKALLLYTKPLITKLYNKAVKYVKSFT